MHDKSKEALQDILNREPFLSRYFNHNPSALDFPTSTDNEASFYQDFFCQVSSVSLLKDICECIRQYDYVCYAIRVPTETTIPIINISRYSQLITESIAYHLLKESGTAIESASLHSIIAEASIKFSINSDDLQRIKRFAAISSSLLPENITWKMILEALASQQNYDRIENQKVQIIAGLLLYLLSKKNSPVDHLLIYTPCNTYTDITAGEFLKIFDFVSMFLKHTNYCKPTVRFLAYYQLSAAGDPEGEQFISYGVCWKNLYESNSYYESDLFKERVSKGLSLVKEYMSLKGRAEESDMHCRAEKLAKRFELLNMLCHEDGTYFDNVKVIPLQSIINYLDSPAATMELIDVCSFIRRVKSKEVAQHLEYCHHVVGLLSFVHRYSDIR